MTVAHTLSVISYHIIANPNILGKLQEELNAALPSSDVPAKWSQLEQLPYLVSVSSLGENSLVLAKFLTVKQSAIIQEGFRSVPVAPDSG